METRSIEEIEFELNLASAGDAKWHGMSIDTKDKNIGYYTIRKGNNPDGESVYGTIKFTFINQVAKYADSVKEKIMGSFIDELDIRRRVTQFYKKNKKFMFESDGLKYWAKVDSSKQIVFIDVYMSDKLDKGKDSHGCYRYLYGIDNTEYSLFEMTTNGFSAFELINPFELTKWIKLIVTNMQDVMCNGNFMTEMKFKNVYLDGYGHPYIVVRLEIMNGHDILMSFS